MSDESTRQSLPITRRREILARDGNECYYCGQQLPPPGRGAQVDHRQPVRHGGTDEDENLVGACGSCNAAKGAMSSEKYRTYVVQRSVPWRAVESLSVILAAHPEWRDMPALWLMITLAARCGIYQFPGELRRYLAREPRDGRPSDPRVQQRREAIRLVQLRPRNSRWGRGRHGDDE